MSITMSIGSLTTSSGSASVSSPVIASWDKGLNFGPLTTTFTPDASCSVPVVVTDPQGPTFIPPMAYEVFVSCNSGDPQYNPSCWPSPTSTYSNFQPWNYGFYSPAYICPHGYSTACSQTPGALSNIPNDPGDFPFQYKPTGGEHAVGCCPTGYSCDFGLLFGTLYQGCFSLKTSATFEALTCINSDKNTTVYSSTLDVTISTVPAHLTQNFQAPLLQLVYQMADLQNSSLTGNASVTTSLANTSSSPVTPKSQRPSGGAIAGIVVGAVMGLCCMLAFVYFLLWRRQRRRESAKTDSSTLMERAKVELSGQANQLHEADGQDILESPEGGRFVPFELDVPNVAHELHSETKTKSGI